MTVLKTFFFFLLFLICFSCSKTPDLNKEEVYKIISDVFIDQNEQIRRVCPEFDTVDLTKYMKGFDAADIAFYRDQKNKMARLKIREKKIKSFVNYYNNNEQFYILPDKDCNEGRITHLSFPYISRDRTKMMISIQDVCNGGFLCGTWKVVYFEKLRGNWVLKETFEDWVS